MMGSKVVENNQMVLFKDEAMFPSTRFQGSKLKIVDWIWDGLKRLNFDTALDAFGGTASVGYMLKSKGKLVTYNDISLLSGCVIWETP